jgi:hypothetical protein
MVATTTTKVTETARHLSYWPWGSKPQHGTSEECILLVLWNRKRPTVDIEDPVPRSYDSSQRLTLIHKRIHIQKTNKGYKSILVFDVDLPWFDYYSDCSLCHKSISSILRFLLCCRGIGSPLNFTETRRLEHIAIKNVFDCPSRNHGPEEHYANGKYLDMNQQLFSTLHRWRKDLRSQEP